MSLILGAAMSLLTVADTRAAEVAHIGTLKLCRAVVLEASVSADEFPERFIAVIHLRDSAKMDLTRVTEVTRGAPIPVTLNGEVVMEPRVMEPIRGGVLVLSGPDKQVLDRIVRAALNDC